MPLYRDEGVVLRTAKLGEADRIVWLFTRGHGKVRAVVKGVRRTRSRFGARLEPFMRADVLVNTGRSLDVVSQAATIAAYADRIVSDYEAYTAANVIVETADKVVAAEREPAPDQYRLLIAALAALARGVHRPEAVGDSYVLRALALAGWSPRLASCVVCGRTWEEAGRTGERYFSVPAGGLMCEADHTPESRRLGRGVGERLRALVDGDWRVLDGGEPGGDVPDGGLDPQTRHIVEEWGAYYLERPIRSLRLLD